MKTLLYLVGTTAIALLLFTKLVEPPHQLDILNAMWPGDGGVSRVAEGVVFDEATGLKLDVWAPEGGADAKKPVLIFYYGGGWAHGARAHYGFAGKAFAAKGFVTVVADYRKVPQVRFPAFNQDGAAAIKWTRDNIAKFGGDPNRIALAGHSAGAYIAVMLALDTHYLSDIGVDPKVVRAAIGFSGPYDFIPFDSKRSINAMHAWPRPLETQPIHYARADAPPIMVVTGTEDEQVKPRNAMLLSQKLHSLGAPVEFKAYEDLDHNDVVMAISKPFRSKAPVLDDAAAFLNKCDK